MTLDMSLVFVAVIGFLFVVSLLTNRNYRNECVGIGVIGTFVGITFSLFQFDSSQISASLPAFIDGLKVAFLSSAAGMIASTFLSISKPDAEASSLHQLVALTKESNEIVERSFSKFSEQSTNQIIEALTSVVEDFNENIERQFGENFKQMNAAFFKLVTWQDKYKEMIELQQKTVEKQHKVLEQQHNDGLKRFDRVAAKESENYRNLQDNYARLAEQQQAILQEQWEQAVEKFNQINRLEQSNQEAVRKQAEAFISLLNNHSKELSSQTQGIHNLMEAFKGESHLIAQSMSSSVKAVNQSISDSVRVAEDNITALIGVANGKVR